MDTAARMRIGRVERSIALLRQKVLSGAYKNAHVLSVQRTKLKRLEAGLCGRCGKNPLSPATNRLQCEPCLAVHRKYNISRTVIPIKSKEHIREVQRAYHRTLKAEVFAAYGDKCACCGETEEKFLSVDHINNDGAKHRKEIHAWDKSPRVERSIYNWLRKYNYPEGFQLLCHNCNHGKHLNGGICPHQMKLKLVVSMR